MVEQIAAPICGAIREFYRGDFNAVVDILMPIRQGYQPIGGSHAQRDVFNVYLIDAAINSNQLDLAKSLLAERVSIYINSYGSWQKYAKVCDLLNDIQMAKHARNEVVRIATDA